MDPRHPRNAPGRPLVLFVEGHEDTRALYALALSANGFDVAAVGNVTEAFIRALQLHPDIIVTDLPMPNCDARQFLQDLRQSPHTRDIPVVDVSGDAQRSLRECAEQNGVTASFPKRYLPDELASALRQVFAGKIHADVERYGSTKRYPL